ncbi:unnamed protein product [Durusdinium trenchii]|uniref:Uncharacterized protein n=2 Tax=Durusdinium trenchii TaxID=1381693 RepID=A0ABP0HFX7_9DINO
MSRSGKRPLLAGTAHGFLDVGLESWLLWRGRWVSTKVMETYAQEAWSFQFLPGSRFGKGLEFPLELSDWFRWREDMVAIFVGPRGRKSRSSAASASGCVHFHKNQKPRGKHVLGRSYNNDINNNI